MWTCHTKPHLSALPSQPRWYTTIKEIWPIEVAIEKLIEVAIEEVIEVATEEGLSVSICMDI